MKDQLIINDSWVLERAGYFSTSFSGFLSKLTGGFKLSTEAKEGLDIVSKLATPNGQAKLGIPDFIQPLISKLTSSFGQDFSTKIEQEVKQSLINAEVEVQKALQQAEQQSLKEIEKAQKEKFSKLDERFAKLDDKLGKMEKTLGQRIASKLFSTNLDSLAKALYEVAKERGVNNKGILNLIRMLPEFEALMYFMNVKKFYRDHTAHSLRVAVLGDYIFEKKGKSGDLVSILKETLAFNKEEARTAWWLAGLLHDIGTPLAKLVTSINWSLVNEMLRCYPSIGMQIIPLQIDICNPLLGNEAYLKILCEGLPKRWQRLIKQGLGKPHSSNQDFVYNAEGGNPPLYQSTGLQIDHGVVAAITLLRTLGPLEQLEKEPPEARPLIEAARAIALHNLVSELGKISFEDYPLLFVLAVADELQEWGRPIPISMTEGFFTTALEKITLLDAVFHESALELWDIPYVNTHAKKLARFDFQRLYSDKQKALSILDCSEQFPESDLCLVDYDEKKSEVSKKFTIKILTH